MDHSSFQVEGMTCNHCVNTVSTEVGKIAGVRRVDVDLAGGLVKVTGEQFDAEAVRTAITESGYEVVSA